jgi:hypothetical protein
MTPPAPDFGFGTGTGMNPNNPPQVAPSNATLESQEIPKPISPLDQIQSYYQQELGRAGDEGGLDYWTGQAKSGMSMEEIRNAINNSQEGQRYDINDLYRTELGREADTGGFDFWLNALQGGMSLDDIRNQGFRASEEYKNRQIEPTFNPYNPPEVYDPYNTPEVQPRGFGPSGDMVPPQYPFPDLGTPAPFSPEFPKPYEPPKVYVDPYLGTPYEGTGGPGRRDATMDGFSDPFQWVISQPQNVQERFNKYLNMFQDPKKAFMYTVTGGPGAPYRD